MHVWVPAPAFLHMHMHMHMNMHSCAQLPNLTLPYPLSPTLSPSAGISLPYLTLQPTDMCMCMRARVLSEEILRGVERNFHR